MIGTGHVIRRVALASVLVKIKCRVVFLCKRAKGDFCGAFAFKSWEVRYRSLGNNGDCGIVDSDEADGRATRPFVEEIYTDWVVINSYSLTSRWEKIVASSNVRLLAIDDFGRNSHYCDILPDQYLRTSSAVYSGSRIKIRLALGPEYALFCIVLAGILRLVRITTFAQSQTCSVDSTIM